MQWEYNDQCVRIYMYTDQYVFVTDHPVCVARNSARVEWPISSTQNKTNLPYIILYYVLLS